MTTVEINGNEKTLGAEVSDGPFASNPPPVADSDYILIQFAGPLNAEQVQSLNQANVKLLERVEDGVYLAGYTPDTFATITNDLNSFVQHAEVYHPGFVIASGLDTNESQVRQKVSLDLHDDIPDGARTERAASKIASVLNIPASEINFVEGSTDIEVSADMLEELAKIDEVKTISKYSVAGPHNNEACKILEAHPQIKTGTNTSIHKGENQIVCVADSGFDTGDTEKYHPAFGNRVKQVFAVGRRPEDLKGVSKKELCNDIDGHGTHVCGSVLGKATYTVTGNANKKVEHLIEAPASEASLIVQSIFWDWDKRDSKNPIDWVAQYQWWSFKTLFDAAYNAGAYIHTNSWGHGWESGYPEAQNIDQYAWEKKDFTILFSAGNDAKEDPARPGYIAEGSIGSQALSKNSIVVGASENMRPGTKVGYKNGPKTWSDFEFHNNPLKDDDVANNIEGMAAFSSRGRTGKLIKPDVVAPGTTILSAKSSNILKDHFSDHWGVSADPKWSFSGGTSMATPLVAGCCAVIRGALEKINGIKTPSAALIKALLINGAVMLKGQYKSQEKDEFGPNKGAPNVHCGFGRVNVKNSLAHLVAGPTVGFGDVSGPNALDFQIPSKLEYNFTITTPATLPTGRKLKITLVWTDFPGEKLQQRLDFSVSSGNVEKHGNMGNGTGWDRVNNVQQIIWDNVAAKTAFKVKVKIYEAIHGPQPFAYAWAII